MLAVAHSNLFAAARDCLAECQPQRKLALTQATAQAYAAGRLTLEDVGAVQPIGEPGRPARPELVPPRQLAQRGLGTPAGRAALVHAVAHIEFNAINLAWDAATDDRGVTEYEVFANGMRVAVTTGRSYSSPVPPPAVFAFGVRAVDAAGNASPFAFRGLATPPDDTQPPTTPTGLTLSLADGLFTVAWTASRDNVMVSGYRVLMYSRMSGSNGKKSIEPSGPATKPSIVDAT